MNKLKGVAKFLLVVFVLVLMVALGGASAVYYENWEKNLKEDESNFAQFLTGNNTNKEEDKKIEPNFTCLFMGRNQHLTDFIMLGQYNPNTREVSLMSIPRDTYVASASVDGKINSIYRYKYPERVVEQVEKITGVEIQHYVVFDAKILQKIINTIGGVTVEVPFDMNYDDPDQDLYIHLKKGVQRLTGAQSEQFVRFRKNNDGTGFSNGDIGRIANQQNFIKAVAAEMLKPANIAKIPDIINIAIDGTDTDITLDVVEKYIGDVVTFRTDRIRMETLPGVGRYDKGPDGVTRSYYFYDEEEAKNVVIELFYTSAVTDNESGDTVASGDTNESNEVQNVTSPSLSTSGDISDGKIRVEVLNANAQTSKINTLVENLNNNNCNVVKIGNYSSTEVESSRIITYGTHTEEELEKIKELTKINKVAESTDQTTVKFSVLIGPNY